jgi:hypothetical protein
MALLAYIKELTVVMPETGFNKLNYLTLKAAVPECTRN